MGNDKETSPKVAKKASDVLRDDRHSGKVKSVAASTCHKPKGIQRIAERASPVRNANA